MNDLITMRRWHFYGLIVLSSNVSIIFYKIIGALMGN